MNHKFLHVLLIAEALDELLQLHNFFYLDRSIMCCYFMNNCYYVKGAQVRWWICLNCFCRDRNLQLLLKCYDKRT